MPGDGGDPHPEWLKHRLDGVVMDPAKMRACARDFRSLGEESASNGDAEDAAQWFALADLQEKSAADEAERQKAVG